MSDVGLYKNPEAIIKAAMNNEGNEQELSAAIAMIPGHFGVNHTATYLGFRALGFTAKQAMDAMDLPDSLLQLWYQEFPELERFEFEFLPDLQRICGFEISRILFMRNMAMFHFQDSWLLAKGMTAEGLNNMSKREFDAMQSRRTFYSGTNLAALGRFGEPEKARGGTKIAIQINNGPQMFIVEADEDTPEMKVIEAPQEEINNG